MHSCSPSEAIPLSSSSHYNARKRSSSWWSAAPSDIDSDATHTILHAHETFQSSAQCNSKFVTHNQDIYSTPSARPRPRPLRADANGSNNVSSSSAFIVRGPPSLRLSPKSVDAESYVVPFPDLDEAIDDDEIDNGDIHNNADAGHGQQQQGQRHVRPPTRTIGLRVRLDRSSIPGNDSPDVHPAILFQME